MFWDKIQRFCPLRSAIGSGIAEPVAKVMGQNWVNLGFLGFLIETKLLRNASCEIRNVCCGDCRIFGRRIRRLFLAGGGCVKREAKRNPR